MKSPAAIRPKKVCFEHNRSDNGNVRYGEPEHSGGRSRGSISPRFRGDGIADKDLAAHITITLKQGRRLYGKEISEVFEPVKGEFYFDSIWNDVADAENAVKADPIYVILNLCRVLAYGGEELILSKREGGEWGLANLPGEYHGLIASAQKAYLSDAAPERSNGLAGQFASYMVNRIKSCVRGWNARLACRREVS